MSVFSIYLISSLLSGFPSLSYLLFSPSLLRFVSSSVCLGSTRRPRDGWPPPPDHNWSMRTLPHCCHCHHRGYHHTDTTVIILTLLTPHWYHHDDTISITPPTVFFTSMLICHVQTHWYQCTTTARCYQHISTTTLIPSSFYPHIATASTATSISITHYHFVWYWYTYKT